MIKVTIYALLVQSSCAQLDISLDIYCLGSRYILTDLNPIY